MISKHKERDNDILLVSYMSAPTLNSSLSRSLVKSPIRMYKDLSVPFNSFVELFVRRWGIINVNLVGNDKAWLGFTCHNHVSQVPIVRLHVTLASSQRQALERSQY